MANELRRRGLHATCGGLNYVRTPRIQAMMEEADRIIVMDGELLPEVPREFMPKVTLADVGNDVWGDPHDPDLKRRVHVMADEWQRHGWTFHPLRLKPKLHRE
jgi:hypothetical protein